MHSVLQAWLWNPTSLVVTWRASCNNTKIKEELLLATALRSRDHRRAFPLGVDRRLARARDEQEAIRQRIEREEREAREKGSGAS